MIKEFLRWFGLAHDGRLSWLRPWAHSLLLLLGVLLLLILLWLLNPLAVE